MGSCASSKREVILPEMTGLVYNYRIIVKIQLFDNNEITGHDVVKVQCKYPLEIEAQECILNDKKYFISFCVLPGMDPRGVIAKECQDGCYFLKKTVEKQDFLVCSLFDGHGREGAKVVEFCKKFQNNFINQNTEIFLKQTAKAIGLVLEKSDNEIKNPQYGIDVSNSGTTAVMAIITKDIIAVGSVGDSRCIISENSEKPVENQQISQENQDKFTRLINPARSLEAVQLTRDQKPEHPDEYNRIIQQGGRVQKLIDEFGNRIGPFRV